MAARLGPCRVTFAPRLETTSRAALASRWTETNGQFEIAVATDGVSHHDLALELLLCLGQALWERTILGEREAYWKLLGEEIEAGVTGEIDEQALREKRQLLASLTAARSMRRFERYARSSFAGTAAEYIHALWHDVTIRSGPEHLPASWLRRRLELLARWFPPGAGYRLFSRVRKSSG